MLKLTIRPFLTYGFQATVLHVVPPVALMLAKHPVVDKFDLTSVREIVVGAAPLSETMSKELQAKLKLKVVRQGRSPSQLLL